VVVVIGHEAAATARWTSLFVVRAFVNDTITVAIRTGLHLRLHSSRNVRAWVANILPSHPDLGDAKG